MKKEYTAPQLKVHGTVEKLTLADPVGKTCSVVLDNFEASGKSECFS